jgi:hypothetical protein
MSADGKQRQRDFADDPLVGQGELHLTVITGGIVVTMTGTDFLVAYRKVKGTPGLVAAKMHDDPHAKIGLAEFLAQAWSAANDKARELGWAL